MAKPGPARSCEPAPAEPDSSDVDGYLPSLTPMFTKS